MKTFLFIFFFLFANVKFFAQQTVTGTVTDGGTGEALIGAVVISDNGKVAAACDVNGNYKMNLANGDHVLQVKFVGYSCDSVVVHVQGKPVIQNFSCSNSSMKEVIIVSDVAIDRKTPVAFSNVGELKIQEEGGSRDMTMLLNSTPGAYASEQGGGAGDSRINIRGVDQRNIGVMVDGVPMNDMENGQVYWANWDGLMDATRTIQVQRGLGASRLAISSVGGTINILTKGIDQQQSFTVRTDFGSNNMQKMYFGFNSGEFHNGWGVTLAGSRRTGNGYADQTWDDEYAYFFKVQKRMGAHLFTWSVNGAPQMHAQRYDKLSAAVYDKKYAQSLGINVDSVYASNAYTTSTQQDRGLRYNPNWGNFTYRDGQHGILSQDINFYHKPLFNFSYFWTPNEKFTLSAVSYVSIGNGGGTNFNQTPTRDTLTGQLNLTSVYNTNSSTIDALYSSTEHKSTRYLQAGMNNHKWAGTLVTATWAPTSDLTVLLGVDARYYNGIHYGKVYDLVGGDYYGEANPTDANQPRGTFLGDPNFQYYKKQVGSKVGYYNESFVNWLGGFTQAEYSKKNWSAFLTCSASQTHYQRLDHFKKQDIVLDDGTVVPMIVGYNEVYYTNGTQSGVAQNGATVTTSGDTTFINNPGNNDYTIVNAKSYSWNGDHARTARTEKKTYPGFTIKGGANYNLDEHYNIFFNTGYMQLAPRFNTVFDNNNRLYPNIKNQEITAFEMGFGARFGKFAANLNGYYTYWKNKAPQNSPTLTTPDGKFTYDLNGLNTLLKGVELDFNYQPIEHLQLEGLLSIGDWKYFSRGTVYLYDANYVLVDTINYSAMNIHMGDAAQTQVGAALRWEPLKGFYIKPRFTYFSRYYSNFDPILLSEVKDFAGTVVSDYRDRESWKMPAYGLFDINAGYEIKENVDKEKNRYVKVGFNIGVTNLLDSKYISDSMNGSGFNADTALVYFGPGRRWNAGMRFVF
ncbi:MAG: TonB-dependent receptor plug domain-containing protein [Bacteroidetes bacterium]|nr:TonB-dependent receptor plug domain-containing protein [Bacteroidota bacterium]